jgi:hypothetical protein
MLLLDAKKAWFTEVRIKINYHKHLNINNQKNR